MNNERKDLLIEIGTEELPAKSLRKLQKTFNEELYNALQKFSFSWSNVEEFITPLRIAVIFHEINVQQSDKVLEQKGPNTKVAFTENGEFSVVALNFIKSKKLDPQKIKTITTEKGSWIGYDEVIRGKTLVELLPNILDLTIKNFKVPRMMRWGAGDFEFVRPVHFLVTMLDDVLIPTELFGIKSTSYTFGHRIHSNFPIAVTPKTYEENLRKNRVIASFAKRKEKICEELLKQNSEGGQKVIVDESLLDEVTGLIEWPVVLLANFPEKYLFLPKELIVTVLRTHQKCFSLEKDDHFLVAKFLVISNLENANDLDREHVISDNEKVVNARLSDAEFFYKEDFSRPLASFADELSLLVFQAQLGTVLEKTKRITKITNYLNNFLKVSDSDLSQIGLLAKFDLSSLTVKEYPELEGIIGSYYLKAQNFPEDVVLAVREHYLPGGQDDIVPQTKLGAILAIADKMDTIAGLFKIGKVPTGDKDPFALKRAAFGIIKIILFHKLALNLPELIAFALNLYGEVNEGVAAKILIFIADRLKNFFLMEKNSEVNLLNAVLSVGFTDILDFEKKVFALRNMVKDPEFLPIIDFNKRISNILRKNMPENKNFGPIDHQLLKHHDEIYLVSELEKISDQFDYLCQNKKYREALFLLSTLKQPIDTFFTNVMVMDKDLQIAQNRLNLLAQIKEKFLKIIDISLL